MDVDIIEEVDNRMLHRTDVTFELTHDEATPSRLQVRDSLAAKLNKGADEVVIRKLDTKFGMRRTIGTAKVYENADWARDVEQEHMLERNKIDEDGVAEEATEEDAPTDAEAEDEATDAEAEGEATDAEGEESEAESSDDAEEA